MKATLSLSSPLPSSLLSRLKLLYFDIRTTLSPLLPPTHPVIQDLSDPLPPSSSPLHSTLALLKDVLIALKGRCAPVRDPQIDALLRKIEEAPGPAHVDAPPLTIPTPLAIHVISIIRSIISLAETMKADLNQFVLGSMSEAQLKAVIIQQAKARERELVLDIWGNSHGSGRERVKDAWSKWIAELNDSPDHINAEKADKHILRLMQALGSTSPVSCNFPPSPIPSDSSDPSEPIQDPPPPSDLEPNALPPQFFFTAPSLLYLQNFLQALIIAASLRSLNINASGNDFMLRIWTLLKTEIDEDQDQEIVPITPTSTPSDSDSGGSTKLINLADEIIRARKLADQPIEAEEETRIRAAVERTLQPHDPVFVLLQKRLMTSIGKRLIEVAHATTSTSNNNTHGIRAPDRMQTGRDRGEERAGKKPRLMIDEESQPEVRRVRVADLGALMVKGFEDPVLKDGVMDATEKVWDCIQWVEGVWGDVIQ